MTDAESKCVRWFGHGLHGHPTHVEMLEFDDGTFGIGLVTVRPGLEPAITQFRLGAKTFELLHLAMARAAHDPTVWKPAPAAAQAADG